MSSLPSYFIVEPTDAIRARIDGAEDPLYVKLQIGDKLTLIFHQDELTTTVAVLKEALSDLKEA